MTINTGTGPRWVMANRPVGFPLFRAPAKFWLCEFYFMKSAINWAMRSTLVKLFKRADFPNHILTPCDNADAYSWTGLIGSSGFIGSPSSDFHRMLPRHNPIKPWNWKEKHTGQITLKSDPNVSINKILHRTRGPWALTLCLVTC